VKKEKVVFLIVYALLVTPVAWKFGPAIAIGITVFFSVSFLLFFKPFYGMVALVLLLPLEIVLVAEMASRITLLKLVSFITLGGIVFRLLSSREPLQWTPVNRYILLFMLAWVFPLCLGDSPDKTWSLIKDLSWFVSLFLIGLYGIKSIREGEILINVFLLEMALISLFGYFQAIAGPQWISSFIFSPIGELLNGPWTHVIKQWESEGKSLYWFIGSGFPRIVGTFYSPGYYCAFLGFPISFALAFFLSGKDKERFIALFVWILMTGNVLLTYSRGGWLSFCFSSLAIIIISGRFKQASILFLGSIPFMFGIVSITNALPVVGERFLSFMVPFESNPRYDMWVAILEKISLNPIFGYGHWGEVVTRKYPYGVHAHSLYFELLYSVGIVGFSVFLIIIGKTMILSFRERKAPGFVGTYSIGYFGALVWFLCHNAVDFQFHHAKNGGVFWFSLGIFFALLKKKGTEP
jgi:hypothetical protein